MKPFGAVVLCLAVASILCPVHTSDNDAPQDNSSEAPSAVTSLTTITGSSDNHETISNGSGNDISSNVDNTSSTPATTSQPTTSVTTNTTKIESSSANETDANERANDTSIHVHKESSTIASQLTTPVADNKSENGSSTANETDADERVNDTSIHVHKELSSSTIASQLTTPVADNKSENGSSTTSGSKSEQTSSFPSGSNIILPVFIPLGLVLFLAVVVVLYKMCKKTPPGEEAQNAAEKPTSKNESVKLLSVKTSPEAGEHSTQRRNKAVQNDESSPHLVHKYI
ncbi:endomucin isoform X1 [Microcaecilia unicolor]|uniref:Endomucin isoform X1 n=1 Tax=Microcaecilia unicolor TaxID=1415580 RepID=A0A6P7WTV4_9AMPH|nr:endomucin isoform X1 [Microcaecilia unicolor]